MIEILEKFQQDANLTAEQYQTLYERSLENPDEFWGEQAERFLNWDTPWNHVSNCNLLYGKVQWFQGGKLNACVNCLDRHLPELADKAALLWEADEPGGSKTLTYQELHQQVCRFSNALIAKGVEPGHRVCIYMPMIPEAIVAMLACARIGAIHTVVFAGFSPEALKGRIKDSGARLIITADEGVRGGKLIPLKTNVDKAISSLASSPQVIVVKRTGNTIPWSAKSDNWYHELLDKASPEHEAQAFDAEHPLFILYTSGSTGKPKGIVHTTGGYLLYSAMTYHYVFDHKPDDIYWCAADIGWITGHSYVVYGPLANGATNLIYEGSPYYPNASRIWEIIDQYQVNTFYTAPTLIRGLMAKGNQPLLNTKRDSLKLLGSVGEPINPEAWRWYFEVVGNHQCPIVDTWWQTETGGVLISPLPGVTPLKPGSASKPFFGIHPLIVDEKGRVCPQGTEGSLVITQSWPGQARTIYNNHQRFLETYFNQYSGYYFTGDGGKKDEDGYFWITGRIDDVMNVSGHRIGTAEIESALVLHPNIAEAAVVGIPHTIKGEAIYAFICLCDQPNTDTIVKEAESLVRREIGGFAIPEEVVCVDELPKTRSGKIMRRILRQLAKRDTADLGDISTLANQEVINKLIQS